MYSTVPHAQTKVLFLPLIQLSQCEGACQALEAELTDHRKKWEESVVISEQHRVSIDELTARKAELEEDVTKNEKRVAELEALLAEVSMHTRAHTHTHTHTPYTL